MVDKLEVAVEVKLPRTVAVPVVTVIGGKEFNNVINIPVNPEVATTGEYSSKVNHFSRTCGNKSGGCIKTAYDGKSIRVNHDQEGDLYLGCYLKGAEPESHNFTGAVTLSVNEAKVLRDYLTESIEGAEAILNAES